MTDDNNLRDKIKELMAEELFTARKVTDIPTDPNSMVSRKFVTLNGPKSARPIGSIMGQFYMDTTHVPPIPLWWNGIGWIDGSNNYH